MTEKLLLTAIIVEDMPQARILLEHDLKTLCPDIEIIGSADSVVSASKLISTNMPDIIFLDIALGDGTGFDILEIFPNLSSKIIFITAFDEYAIRAFRFSAIDYLLKPIDPELLVKAIAKVKISFNYSEKLEVLRETVKTPKFIPSRISLHTIDKIVVVNILDIIRCEADANNTWFFLDNREKIYVTKTLKHFENMLVDYNFIRVHQSHLINFNYIKEFSKKDGGFIRMKNGNEIPVSVRKRPIILQMFEDLG